MVQMKNFMKLLVVFCLTLVSCSETTEYNLPYELSPVAVVNANVDVSGTNVVCSNASVNFTVDSEATVYYVVLPESESKPSSNYVYDQANIVSFEQGGSKSVLLPNLDLGSSYTVSSITVNKDGTRSSEVITTSFSTPSRADILANSFSGNYTGQTVLQGSVYSEFTPTLVDNGDGTFSVDSFFGDFVANATGNEDYVGQFQYPGTLEINDDFTVSVKTDNGYATGGTGTYDPCTDTFNLTLDQFIFTEDDGSSSFDVNVVFSPAE